MLGASALQVRCAAQPRGECRASVTAYAPECDGKAAAGSRWFRLAKDLFVRDCVLEHMRGREFEHGSCSFEENSFFKEVQVAWRRDKLIGNVERSRMLLSMSKLVLRLGEDERDVLYIANWIPRSDELAMRRREGRKRPARCKERTSEAALAKPPSARTA